MGRPLGSWPGRCCPGPGIPVAGKRPGERAGSAGPVCPEAAPAGSLIRCRPRPRRLLAFRAILWPGGPVRGWRRPLLQAGSPDPHGAMLLLASASRPGAGCWSRRPFPTGSRSVALMRRRLGLPIPASWCGCWPRPRPRRWLTPWSPARASPSSAAIPCWSLPGRFWQAGRSQGGHPPLAAHGRRLG